MNGFHSKKITEFKEIKKEEEMGKNSNFYTTNFYKGERKYSTESKSNSSCENKVLEEKEKEKETSFYNKFLIYSSSFTVGSIAAAGIALSGMAVISRTVNFFVINKKKIIKKKKHNINKKFKKDISNYLSSMGTMDLSLIFAMGGALIPNIIGYRYLRGKKPFLFKDYSFLPTSKDLDKNLIIGSLLFGVGW